MKDFRRQGQTVQQLGALFKKYPRINDTRVHVTGRAHCARCGVRQAWFYLYPDMAVCTKCKARYATRFPGSWFVEGPGRATCKVCFRMKFALYQTNAQCQCGTAMGLNGSIMLTPLFDIVPDLEQPAKILSPSSVRKLIKKLEEKKEAV